MRSSARLKIILIGLIVILIIVALNFYSKGVRNFFYSLSSPVQKIFWRAGKGTSDFFTMIGEMKRLKAENDELAEKNQALLAENALLAELKAESETLRMALNLGLEKEFKLTLAQVIGKDIAQDSLIIDKGLKDGISKNMPVITEQKNLLGKISEVYDNFSRVMLISNKDSSFDANVSEKEIYGIIRGEGGFRVSFERVPHDQDLKVGDILVTSALGGVFPKGLLVGQVKEVKKSDVDPFQQAEVSPFFDINNLETLFVISAY
jgi:rod shape-determining protein MreC